VISDRHVHHIVWTINLSKANVTCDSSGATT